MVSDRVIFFVMFDDGIFKLENLVDSFGIELFPDSRLEFLLFGMFIFLIVSKDKS